MDPIARIDAFPEAMGDVPGVCEVSLTRAVVQYRDVHEMDAPGGRIEDIGLAAVLEGRFAATSEAIDLGSGKVKVLDLSTELVVLDWLYEPTVQHLCELVTASAITRGRDALTTYAFRLGVRVLERVGFGPLTRPTFLRVGYRDICRDFDLHEGTSIRFVLGRGRLTRAYLDYDACALSFRTAFHTPDAQLERALLDSFPTAELRRVDRVAASSSIEYAVRLPLPTTLGEARTSLTQMRRGLAMLMARFEPDRFASIERLIETFGARETLDAFRVTEAVPTTVPMSSSGSMRVVH